MTDTTPVAPGAEPSVSDTEPFPPGGGAVPAPPPKSPAEPVGWSGMFVPPELDSRSPGGFSTERALLTAYLGDHRKTLELKCADLGPEELARRSVPPSNLSLLGLVRHMAAVEHHWFRRVLAGEDVPWHYRTAEDYDADFNGAVADPAVVAQAWRTWRAEVAFAERFTADAPDLGITGRRIRPELQLREILLHMIEEYARHCGHADFLRERIDGRAGL